MEESPVDAKPAAAAAAMPEEAPIAAPAAATGDTPVSRPFRSDVMATTDPSNQNKTGEAVSLCTGRYINFEDVCADDFTFPEEERQRRLRRALEETGIRTRPCMVVDLAPMRALEVRFEDSGEAYQEPEAIAAVENPPCARIVVAASDIVDIRNLKPAFGRSIVRCNAAFPAYRWFQAMNLILHHEGKTPGRVVPFPLESTDGTNHDDTGAHGPNTHIIYNALRVSMHEFEAYQKVLALATENDGAENGFFHAAKFAYEILFKRGYKEINESVVSDAVTTVVLMGKSVIRGVLVDNSEPDDFGGNLAPSHFIHF